MTKCGAKATPRECSPNQPLRLQRLLSDLQHLVLCVEAGVVQVLWPLTPVCGLIVFPCGALHVCNDGHMMKCRDVIKEKPHENKGSGALQESREARVRGKRHLFLGLLYCSFLSM